MSEKIPRSTDGNRTCARCGAVFTCGIAAGNTHCWCFDLPNVIPLDQVDSGNDEGCLCPDCLRAKIAQYQHDDTHQ